MQATTTWAIVLAGGDGRRVRDLTSTRSGTTVPKQFCSLDGGKLLVELAVDRAERLVSRERILVSVNDAHRRWWRHDLADLPPGNVLAQPSNRGTAPGLLHPLLELRHRDPNAAVVVLPADHWVADEVTLETAVRQALLDLAAHPGAVVLLGVRPEELECDYGWVVPGEPEPADGPCPVACFVEKPSSVEARRLRALGGVWNSFIFAAHVDRLVGFYEEALPSLVWSLRMCRWDRGGPPSATLEKVYRHLPSADFSRDVLERMPHALRVRVVPPCGWSDLGTPDRISRWARHHGGPSRDRVQPVRRARPALAAAAR